MNNQQLEEALQTCEQEQLHLSGMIQPFGTLMAVNCKDSIITHVAQNIQEFIPYGVEELLGKNIDVLLPHWKRFFKRLEDDALTHPYIYQKIKEENIYLKVSCINESFVIDIQRTSQEALNNSLKKDQHKLFITPDSKESYENYIQNYMDMVSGILQFDRVMLYQFQEDWSGEVVAERVASDDFGSYLNLRFPASDIPKIARDLYLLNPSRIIADTQAKNIDIIAFNSELPDLTYSDTRSVSPVHIEYLKNMGVIASFSIPIVISDNLWGLLACHNLSQKILDPLIKDTAIEKTKLFALGVKNFLAKEKLNYLDVIQYKINDILDSILNLPNLEEQILNKEEEILRLISSDGFAIVVHNRVIAVGKLPEQNSFRLIDSTFLEMSDNTFITDCISLEMLEDKDYLGPTGVLGIKSVAQGSTILRCYWFRNEFIEELHWAGNPNKPVIEDAGAMRLSPRRSFESFIEIKRGYSKKFNPLEVSTALNFSNKIFNYLRKVT